MNWLERILAAVTRSFAETPAAGAGGGPAAGGGASPAGGGPAPAAGTSDPGGGRGEAGAGDTGGAAGAGEDADADVDGVDNEELIAHLPETELRPRMGREARRNRRLRPILDQLRDEDGRRLRSPEWVRERLDAARQRDELNELFQSDPELYEAFIRAQARRGQGGTGAFEEPAARRGPAPAREAPAADAPFDEAGYPFEAESAEGRYQKAHYQKVHALEQKINRLEAQLSGVNGHLEQQSIKSIEQHWAAQTKRELDAAGVDDAYRPAIVEAVKQTFRNYAGQKNARQLLARVNVKQILDRILAGPRQARQSAARGAAARASAAAVGNGGLPTITRPGAIVPAAPGAGGPPKRETIKDASSSFLKRART